MKRLLPLFALCAIAGTTHAAQTDPVGKSLPYGDCMRIDQINDWHVVDNRTVIARNGPKPFLIKLTADCPRLAIGVPGLLFRGSDADKAVGGRICGGVGETVRSREQPPCAIASVTPIDRAQYDALSKHAVRHGSGADQPSPVRP